MIINLSPTQVLPGETPALALLVAGDVLTIDGTALDFSLLDEGDILPGDAIEHEGIVGEVTREAGDIVVTVRLPIGSGAPESARFPAPIQASDGQVTLPPLFVEPEPEPEPLP